MRRFLILLALPVLFSCQERKAEMSRLVAENDSLKIMAGQNDRTVMDYVEAFNDVQDNLEKIKETEGIVTMRSSDPELQQAGKDQIIEDINLIYDLMLENKKKVESLQRKLNNSNTKNKELEKMIRTLQQQIFEKDAEIAKLKTALASLNIKVDSMGNTITNLETSIAEKDVIIKDQVTELNTAYYVWGTEDELKEQKILTKEGGFIGIGKNAKLKQDFTTTYFTKIDLTTFNELPLSVKSAKMITTHPSDSYEFTGDKKLVESLKITDPKKFWSRSKYLVIVVES